MFAQLTFLNASPNRVFELLKSVFTGGGIPTSFYQDYTLVKPLCYIDEDLYPADLELIYEDAANTRADFKYRTPITGSTDRFIVLSVDRYTLNASSDYIRITPILDYNYETHTGTLKANPVLCRVNRNYLNCTRLFVSPKYFLGAHTGSARELLPYPNGMDASGNEAVWIQSSCMVMEFEDVNPASDYPTNGSLPIIYVPNGVVAPFAKNTVAVQQTAATLNTLFKSPMRVNSETLAAIDAATQRNRLWTVYGSTDCLQLNGTPSGILQEYLVPTNLWSLRRTASPAFKTIAWGIRNAAYRDPMGSISKATGIRMLASGRCGSFDTDQSYGAFLRDPETGVHYTYFLLFNHIILLVPVG